MNRFYWFILLSLSVFGCQLKDEQVYKVGFSQCISDDQWRQQMHEDMRRELSFYPQLSLEIKDAHGNNELQAEQIRGFIEEGVDLLIVSPNEAAPITPAVEAAFTKGIPVIIVDRKTTSSLYTAYVGADNYEIGKTAGDYVLKFVNPGDKIIEIWGLKGSTPAVNRNEGFVQAMDTAGVEIISVYSDWTKDTAKKKFREVINQYPNTNVVFAHNDMMALGAFEVARELGIEKNIKFIGVDALPGPIGGIQLVMDGILDATFLYPTGGEEAIRIAHSILTNQHFQKENILQTTAIDASNVRIMKLQTDKILSQQKYIERQIDKISNQIRIYQNQRTALYLLVGSLTISIVLGAYALYSLIEKKAAYKKLNVQTIQIKEQKEQIEVMAAKAEVATQQKFKFFTNISHEFRTPLTLILGPVEELIHNKNWPANDPARQNLSLIKKNAFRLLRLVNQLMDFRKLENNSFKLQVSKNNIGSFVEDIKSSFDKIAKERKIDYRIVNELGVAEAWFDENILDKVLFNLLSNAFKFTPEKGFIHIYLSQKPDSQNLIIKVQDNGRGMSKEHVEHAFERFYQGEQYSHTGTGIGLSLSKELIALHKGEIKVESEKNKGTIFTIIIPSQKEAYKIDELLQENVAPIRNNDNSMLYSEYIDDIKSKKDVVIDGKQPTILIVEDSMELISFLKNGLTSSYRVIYSTNGVDGIALAIDEIPDLIICDVMIPEKDGLAVTLNLKSDFRTSHIPVIMLTARTEEKQRLEGILSGADVYITKPFDLRYLHETINTLLKNREKLKAHFLQGAYTEEAEEPTHINDLEEKFINRFKTIVEENLSDPHLSVNEICNQIGFSRVQLYRKVKAILGCSINDYINEMRLKKAKKLLSGTDMNVSEVAYETGFSSPTYFSTAFKNHYKISPSEYKTDKRKA